MASELHPLNFKPGKCVISVFLILPAFCGALVKTFREVHLAISPPPTVLLKLHLIATLTLKHDSHVEFIFELRLLRSREKYLVPTLELIKTAALNVELGTQIKATANKLRDEFAQ